MKRSKYLLFIIAFLFNSLLYGKSSYRYLCLNMEELEEMKFAVSNGDKSDILFIDDLLNNAKAILGQKPYSVTFKDVVPPSGDKHDYISMAPYWWPDPSKSGTSGLPYIRRDGKINPQRNSYTDQSNFNKLMSNIHSLGLAYYFTQDEKYVQFGMRLISVFFIDEKTRMNPNLSYGQFVPGRNEGRSFGIIETAGLRKMLEGVALFSKSASWSSTFQSNLQIWIDGYYDWLQNSDLGIEERNSINNHGTHYDEQCLAMLLFLDRTEEAKKFIYQYTLSRLKTQIASDGSQPFELARTKSWNYTNMNMLGFYDIALMAEKIDIDLWNYKDNEHIYLKSMIDWFVPYLQKTKKWKWKQIIKVRISSIEPILRLAALKYHSNSYLAIISQLKTIDENIVYESN